MRYGYPDLANWAAIERIKEAKHTGAQALVTYCPHCEEHFGEVINTVGENLKMVDLLDLVLKAI